MPSDAKKKRAAAKKEAAKKRTLTKGKRDEQTNGVANGACAGKHMFKNKLLFNVLECFKLAFLDFSCHFAEEIGITDYMCQFDQIGT